ncbi:hypothetical protein WY02_01515 [Pseudonocardia sp. AL041005-10]|nr:hypothetical protein WY02_01515 [Pseudonocardia sp. AL041005-10]
MHGWFLGRGHALMILDRMFESRVFGAGEEPFGVPSEMAVCDAPVVPGPHSRTSNNARPTTAHGARRTASRRVGEELTHSAVGAVTYPTSPST